MKILVVEDDDVQRLMIQKTLESLGHKPVGAANGLEASKLLTEDYFPVVVSDWLMPHMDGLELCRFIRSRASDRYTYVILLTLQEGKENLMQALEAGVDDFITKLKDFDLFKAKLKIAERIMNLHLQVKELSAMLPICSYCKKVRDDKNYWQQIETYVTQTTGAALSHSICPACYQTQRLVWMISLRN
jgi:CheY-like chemotaxis protein